MFVQLASKAPRPLPRWAVSRADIARSPSCPETAPRKPRMRGIEQRDICYKLLLLSVIIYKNIYIYVYISIIIYSLKIYIFYFCNETTEMWKESLAEVPNIDSNRVLGAFDSFSSSDSRARSRAITVILTKSYETMKCKKDTYMY